ncbi:MAG: potassium channel family protein, partial [Longimicrobiales bacterium]
MKGISGLLEDFLGAPDTKPEFQAFFRFLFIIAIVVTVFAAIFHVLMIREGQEYSLLTGFYWALTVMTTLGFGDITFQSDLGRVFTMLVLLTGVFMLLIVLPFVFIRHFYAPWLQAQLLSRAPKRVSSKVRDHVVVCGYDEVAQGLVGRLNQEGIPSVLIEPDPVRASTLHQDKFPVVTGAVDSRITYEAAGLERAQLLVANMT